jgi:hypothetical protein
MQEIIKELTISDATLNILEDGRRIQLADCRYEHYTD